ncbi:CIC11C00000001786 [Sungouiella intermedia]|uniref:6-O-methylguanine-DNA methyltransferase n=1 Tax=Sungouiella intermedia TaxID=45354 RepID=A0A1L0BGY0_9ASCO|nr:CIC11C00000001786 [[Candida] intermedia]SGZ49506.1 CIC11C00000002275 [[Candida] intermedia]
MRLDEESKAFHYAVYAVVGQIPYGKVTSYGHIAYLIGRPKNARQVGSSLKHSEYIVSQLNLEDAGISDLPWWRVILSAGTISKRDSGEYEQARRLQDEKVVVDGMKVDLDDFGWFPDLVDI